jgi:hypothetical protein
MRRALRRPPPARRCRCLPLFAFIGAVVLAVDIFLLDRTMRPNSSTLDRGGAGRLGEPSLREEDLPLPLAVAVGGVAAATPSAPLFPHFVLDANAGPYREAGKPRAPRLRRGKPVARAPPDQYDDVKHVWRAAVSTAQPYAYPRPDFFVLSVHRVALPMGYDPNVHDAANPPPLASQLEEAYIVLGEGVIDGVSFPTPSTVRSDLECTWGESHKASTLAAHGLPSTPARVQLMRYKLGAIDYREQRTPYSSRDAYQTHYLICKPPPGGTELAVEPHLRGIRSPSTQWHVALDASEVHEGARREEGSASSAAAVARANADAVARANANARARAALDITVCAAPVYGTANVRWLVEWLEYLRAVGVSTVHVPMYEDERSVAAKLMWDVLHHYSRLDAATGERIPGGLHVVTHHWSSRSSRHATDDGVIYERGKYLAWDECYLRGRGRTDWLLFLDVDELPFAPRDAEATLVSALRECDALLDAKTGGKGVGCALNSVTATSVFKGVEDYATSGKLLLDEYDYVESAPKCPYNCGKYHRGRQKYIVKGRDVHMVPLMMWTHSVGGQDYEYADKVLSQLPSTTMHIRHYSGWWYTNGPHTEMAADEHLQRKASPLQRAALARIEAALAASPSLKKLYDASPAKNGVTWVKATAKP